MTKPHKLDSVELDQLLYFWTAKGNLESYVFWNELQPELKARYPEIVKAWDDYKTAERMMSAALMAAQQEGTWPPSRS